MLALQTVCCHNFSFYFFIVRNALFEWALTCNTKNLCNDCCHESTCSLTNLLQKEFKKAGHLFKEWLEWLKHSKNIHQVANLLAQSPVFSLCINYSLTKHNISKFHYCIIMLVHMKQGFFKFSPCITSRKFMYAMFLFAFFQQEVSAQAKMIVFAFRRLALCFKAYS